MVEEGARMTRTFLLVLLCLTLVFPTFAQDKTAQPAARKATSRPAPRRAAPRTSPPPRRTQPQAQPAKRRTQPAARQAPTSRPAPKKRPTPRNDDEEDDSTETTEEPPLYSIDTPTAKAPPAHSTLAKILKSQLIRVCVRADIPPFGHFVNNALVGFDIQLAREISTQISIYYKKNLRLTWSVINANSRVSSLENNHCDMVVAAFSITPSRQKKVAFSEPYLQTYKVKVKKTKITRNKPVTAVVTGTTQGKKKPKGIIRAFLNYNEIINAMDRGEIDYVMTDQPIAIHMLRSISQEYMITQVLSQMENYGVGVNKKSAALLKAVNRALRDLARTGRLAYTQRQWL
ncbi:MAG: transporter substrate-binding domain-containing protein [Deltaproteobacteria bacterium]|nr:MAG: transporter substrate-binding domain-containing protein [Deltaproteobacteria bacterium]